MTARATFEIYPSIIVLFVELPPWLVAFGVLLSLAAVARDVYDYEQVPTIHPTGFLIAFVAGAVLSLIGAVRSALWAIRHGG